MSADRIAIRGIRAFGRHGALAGERERVQPFDIDVELEIDASAARRSDSLEDTIDYAEVHTRIVRVARERSYQLLERLGDDMLSELMQDRRITGAAVTIAKPAILDGATPSVRVTAKREA